MPADEAIRLLIVEDQADYRLVLRRVLERDGVFTVVGEAGNGQQAIALASEHTPDVVLLDLRLPGEDGRALLPRLVASLPRSMVAVLTNVEPEDAEAVTLAQGAFTYYEKEWGPRRIAAYLVDDLASFRRALAGEDVVAPSAVTRDAAG